MLQRGTRNEKLALLLMLALMVSAAMSVLGQVTTRVVCEGLGEGGWPFLLAGFGFLLGNDAGDVFGTTSTGCAASNLNIWAVYIPVAVVLIATALFLVIRHRRYLASPKFLRKDILSRKEIAKRSEVRREMGPKTAVRRGKQVRPLLAASAKRLDPADVSWQLGHSEGVPVWVSMEDAVILIGPPRSGKGYRVLTPIIVEAPGAVVTTSTRGDNMESTILSRSRVGPVYLFDPENVTGRTTTIRWSPVRGCENGDVAKKRAGVLVAGTGLGGGQNQEWAGKAADVLQCLLHAAAISGADMSELHTWTKSPTDAHRALDILETESPLGWGPMLQAVLEMEPKSRDAQWFGVASSLSALDVPNVRELFDVAPGQAMFDPEQFLLESATLYLTAELRQSVSAPGGVGVFFSMLLDDIAEAAHRVAMRTHGGRLDPPCTFVLDEIANIHPWQGLPQAMAAGSGEGLQVVAVFQSRNQAREGWGDNGEGTIWESATRKLLLGGATDSSDLRGVSELLGMREDIGMSQSFQGATEASFSEQLRERPVLSLDELRRLPERNVLLVAGRARPMLVDLKPWTSRSWAKQIHKSKAWHKANPASQHRGITGPTYTRGAPTALVMSETALADLGETERGDA